MYRSSRSVMLIRENTTSTSAVTASITAAPQTYCHFTPFPIVSPLLSCRRRTYSAEVVLSSWRRVQRISTGAPFVNRWSRSP